MRMAAFAKRVSKEILRDPLNLFFGICFSPVLMLLMSAIGANVPVEQFQIERLAPGIAVFGLSFMTLFSATLISKDRCGSLLQRLYTTPLLPTDFILGYVLPMIPMAIAQGGVCYALALILGLPCSVNILWAVILMIPISLLFISLGLLCGSALNDKAVGGVCGALLTNLCAWLSGAWFDLALVGGAFRKVAYALPFVHAVELERAVLKGDLGGIFPHLWWVLGYAALIFILAVFAFFRQMKRQ